MYQRFILRICLLIALVALCVQGAYAQSPTDSSLVILFTHDIHSYLTSHRVDAEGSVKEVGGVARIAGQINLERGRSANRLLVLDAGDFSMGTLYHTIFETGAAELHLLGKMGYDATTLGNHEFDFHSDGLAAMLRAARAQGERLPPIVASNISFSAASALSQEYAAYPIQDYVLIEKNGLRIGLFGLIGKDAQDDVSFAPDVTFGDPIQAAKRVVDVLKNKEKADVVIALSHSGTSSVSSQSEDENLARAVPQIDVIISGHTHTVLTKPIIIGKTVIVSAGSYGAYLGRLEMDFAQGSGRVLSYGLREISADLPEDKSVADDIAAFTRQVSQNVLSPAGLGFDQPIANVTYDFESLGAMYDVPGESGLGDLITDAYRYAAAHSAGSNSEFANAAIEPIGMIRDTPVQGKLTVADIFRVLSLGLGLDNQAGFPLVAFYLNGDEIKQSLEVETSVAALKPDFHLQMSGVQFHFNPNRMLFDRVTSVQLQDPDGAFHPAQAQRLYRLVVNYNVAVGLGLVSAKSYGILKLTPKDKEGRPIADLKDAVIDADPAKPGIQELKEWQALAAYLKSLPDTDGDGLSNIPDRYRAAEGRFGAVPSWNPLDLVWNPAPITLAVLGIAAAVLALVAGTGALVIRKIRR